MKRMTDIVLAFSGLVIAAPLLLLIGGAIMATDGLPFLFRQHRVGRGGRDFVLLKFRSMTVLEGADQGRFDAGSPARVTPIGRWLRHTKLDELPQLWNVLVGDMSLVGPRPEVRQWVEAFPEQWARVLTVRPGLTDPASIVYRHEEAILARSPAPETTYRATVLPHKLQLYEGYVRTQSWWGDIKILAATARVLLPGGHREDAGGGPAT